jgi:restriction system protein
MTSLTSAIAVLADLAAPVPVWAGVLLIGVLAIYTRRRRARIAEAASTGSPITLHGLTWGEFQTIIGEGFRRRGYRVAPTGAAGAEGGVDLVLTRGEERFLVQCKQWKTLEVGVRTLRDLYGTIEARAASGGFLVTSGTFSEEAQRFAADHRLELIDGNALSGWLNRRIEPEIGRL